MKNKLKFLAAFTLLSIGFANAQVGIGTNTPDVSAVLDVSSTTKGLLLPRLTSAQRFSITTPAKGLVIFNTSTNQLEVNTGTTVAPIWTSFNGVASTGCGAFVATGVFKQFACHNLGATNTSLDPNVPVQAIHGNYYQWGRSTVVATASTAAGAIGGWNTTPAANGAWLDGSKTGNDPCPAGFRVPTKTQWDGVINASLNTVSRTGTWVNSASNFGTAIHYGPSVSDKTLTLPAAGNRLFTDGTLFDRGEFGFYWSSTENGTGAWNLYFVSTSADSLNFNRTEGFSVRCVSE